MHNLSQNTKTFLYSYWIIISITFVSLLLRLYGLGAQSVWIDEVVSLRIAMRPLWFSLTFIDPTPPLYYAVLSIWQHLFHNSLFFSYLLSILLGVALVIVTYFFVKRYFSRSAAVISALLVAVNPAFIYYSQEIRVYSLFFLLALATVYIYWNYREDFRLKNGVLFGLFALALLYTHTYGAIIVFAIAVDFCLWYFWLQRKNKFYVSKQKRTIFSTLLIFGLLFVAYLPWLSRLKSMIHIGMASWIVEPDMGSLWYLARTYMASHIYSHFYLPAILIFSIFVVCALFYYVSKTFSQGSTLFDVRMSSLSLLGVLVVLIPFSLSFIVTPFFVTRYALVSLVFFLPLFCVLLSQIKQKYVMFTFLFIIILTCLCVIFVQSHTVLKDDWRSVSEIAIDSIDVQNIPVMVTPVYNALALGYYVNQTCLERFDEDEQIYRCLAVNNRIHTIPNLTLGIEFEPDSFLLVLDQRINTTEGGDEFMLNLAKKYDLTHVKTFQMHTSNYISANMLGWFDGNSLYRVEFSELYVFLAQKRVKEVSFNLTGAK